MREVRQDNRPRGYYVDPYLLDNLNTVKPHVLKNWDMCFIVSGVEGAGKSTFAMQLGDILSGDRFTVDNVCMTPKDFMDKITRPDWLQPGDTLLLDEGFMINSRSSMSKQNREFLSVLAECRQKQLFLIIVCPNFFDLDKNLALWRSRGLFYVDHVGLERGYYKFWGYDKKKKLYVLGKKFYEYHKVKYDIRGRFRNVCPIDEEQYKKIKLKAFEIRKDTDDREWRGIEQRNKMFYYLNDKLGIGWADMSRELKEYGVKIGPDGIRKAVRTLKSERRGNSSGHTTLHKGNLSEQSDNKDVRERGK